MLTQNNKLVEENLIIERNVSNLNETRANQKIEISKLIEDNQKLVRLVNENERCIKSLESERIKQLSRIEELSFEIKNTVGKLNSREENLNFSNKSLEDAKATIARQNHSIRDLEKMVDNHRIDNNSLNLSLKKEKNVRNDAEKMVSQLQQLLSDREREINRYIADVDGLRSTNNKTSEEKYILANENERLKNHIMTLTEQNQGVNYYNLMFNLF